MIKKGEAGRGAWKQRGRLALTIATARATVGKVSKADPICEGGSNQPKGTQVLPIRSFQLGHPIRYI